MKPTKEQFEAVAEWWAVRTFDHALNQNNGDDSQTGGITFMLMNMLSSESRSKTVPEDRQKFKDAIVVVLGESERMQLDVDYNPNDELRQVCHVSGINSSMLPCKTFTMWDKQKQAFIGKYQYRGQFETIA